MKDFFKRIRADLLISSILCVACGVVLIMKPIETVSIFCQLIAIGMMVVGALFMFSYFLNWMSSGLSAAMGLIVVLIGVMLFINPGIIETLVPIVIGVVLLCHGIQAVKLSWDAKHYGESGWVLGMILAIVSVILGVLCIIDAFMVTKAAVMLLGIALIYNGVSNFLITAKVTHAARKYNRSLEPVDVEFKE